MANITGIIEGLKILRGITSDSEYCCAEHDILYGPGKLEDLTPEEIEALNHYAWYWDEDLESWYTFT